MSDPYIDIEARSHAARATDRVRSRVAELAAGISEMLATSEDVVAARPLHLALLVTEINTAITERDDALARVERAEADNAALREAIENHFKDTSMETIEAMHQALHAPFPGAALLSSLAAADALVVEIKHLSDEVVLDLDHSLTGVARAVANYLAARGGAVT